MPLIGLVLIVSKKDYEAVYKKIEDNNSRWLNYRVAGTDAKV